MHFDKNNRPNVIVRAWGDEPVVLQLYRIANKRCYVGGSRSACAIGLPFDQVFAFDSHKFSTMRTCFEQGKMAELKGLYDSLSVDDFACNRYQDKCKLCP